MENNCPQQIQEWLELPVSFARSNRFEGLDFSTDSLELTDWCLEQFRKRQETFGEENNSSWSL